MKRYITKINTEKGTFVVGGSGYKNSIKKKILDLEASGISKKDIEIIPVKNDKTVLGLIIAAVIGVGVGFGIKTAIEKRKQKKENNETTNI